MRKEYLPSPVSLSGCVVVSVTDFAAASNKPLPRKRCPPLGAHGLPDADHDGYPDVCVTKKTIVGFRHRLKLSGPRRSSLSQEFVLCVFTCFARCDNCPRVSNKGQHDIDKDHIGDVRG